ncbi:hypothetical protein RB195_022938 [Necator americanus]|uniref:Uncharacterized protein n=1 Tax=Necator americanus TaxID=51031 RepID=A0ABR1EHS0_NECAM
MKVRFQKRSHGVQHQSKLDLAGVKDDKRREKFTNTFRSIGVRLPPLKTANDAGSFTVSSCKESASVCSSELRAERASAAGGLSGEESEKEFALTVETLL